MRISIVPQIGRDRGTPIIWAGAVLALVAATFSFSAIAANPPNTKAASAAHGKSQDRIQQDSFQFGVSRSINPPGSGSTGRESGQPNLNEIRNSAAANPCKSPNPPRSCNRPRPSH